MAGMKKNEWPRRTDKKSNAKKKMKKSLQTRFVFRKWFPEFIDMQLLFQLYSLLNHVIEICKLIVFNPGSS